MYSQYIIHSATKLGTRYTILIASLQFLKIQSQQLCYQHSDVPERSADLCRKDTRPPGILQLFCLARQAALLRSGGISICCIFQTSDK